VLESVVVSCSALQCVAECCSVLQFVAECCNEICLGRKGVGVKTHSRGTARPNRSFMFPYRYIDFRKVFYLSFSTNIQNHVPEIFILQNLILRTRSCGTGFITESSWGFHFHLTTLFRWKDFVPQLYQLRRGISEGSALKYFYMIHRGG